MKLEWTPEGKSEVAFAGGFMFFAFVGHFEVFYVGNPKEYYDDYPEGEKFMIVEEDESIVYVDIPVTIDDAKASAEKWFQEHITAVSTFKN